MTNWTKLRKPIIATLAGHSALDIFYGAHRLNFKTLAIVQKGRELTYLKYFQNLIDESIAVKSFAQLTDRQFINKLKDKNCIFIPHRYCQVYCDLDKLEKSFPIPIFGNKFLLKYEERTGKYNQYLLMNKAKISYPKRIIDPSKINSLVIVKVNEVERKYERAFFFAKSYNAYKRKSSELIKNRLINKNDLKNAVIEEYLIGAQVNFNFFYSLLTEKLELLGTDTRRQTNIDGLIRIPSVAQHQLGDIHPSYIESGHIAVTVKESLLEKAFAIVEKLLQASRKISFPGIIGPFALQTAIIPGPPQEKIVAFDLSLRIPGSPGTVFTPYSQYLYDRPVSFGERIAMEIQLAQNRNLLNKITT